MPLKLTLDSLDGLSSEVAALYEQKDGKYRLAVDGAEDASEVRAALEKERRSNRELAGKIKKWEGLGKTEEEIAALLSEHEDQAARDAEKKGEWDKLRTQMVEKHDKALAAKDAEIASMQAALEEHLIDAALIAEIAAHKGEPELVLPVARRQVKVVKEEGKYRAIAVDQHGTPRVDAKGNPMPLSDIIKEMRESPKFGRAFEASGAQGSGKGTGNGIQHPSGQRGFPQRPDADMGGDQKQRTEAIRQKLGDKLRAFNANPDAE